jgi:hypothetical protein
MNASNLADHVGMPRSTMDLEELEWVGRVERRGRQEAVFAVDALLTGSSALEAGLYWLSAGLLNVG